MYEGAHLVRPAVGVLQRDVGLLPDAVKVLVETVQEEGQQLVGVLLLVPRELGGEPAHLRLEEGHACMTPSLWSHYQRHHIGHKLPFTPSKITFTLRAFSRRFYPK